MATFDQMIIDDRDLANRYFGDNHFDELDDEQYLLNNNSQPFQIDPLIKTQPTNDNDENNLGLFGRRVFLESPALGDKQEEDLYRYVPSRLSEHPSTVVVPSVPAPTGETLIDSLDFELDILGAGNTRSTMPFRTNPRSIQDSKPPAPLTQMTNPITPMTNMRRADPRQDPLLGPLLAELDAMSAQHQQQLSQTQLPPAPGYRRNSVPYEPNLSRPPAQSQSNHVLTSTGNRTLNNALFETDLYDSLEQRNQQISPVQQRQAVPLSAPNINSSNQPRQPQPQPQQQQLPPRQSNMNSTDVFLPSSYGTGPASFLSNFGPEDQLFQQPLFNAMGENYVPNTRAPPPPPPPPQQQQQTAQQQYERRDGTFDNPYGRTSPPVRPAYAQTRPQQQQPPPPQPANRQLRYNDNTDPFSEYHEMFAPSRYQRPPTPPSDRRPPPPPSQQQRALPQPTSYQQQQPRSYPPSQQQQPRYYDDPSQNQSQEMFFTDHNDDQMDQFSHHQLSTRPGSNQHNEHDQDSRRQAVWDELQRNNAKVQEKNAKKRESANRREQLLKGNYNSSNAWNGSNQSSAQSKRGGQSPPSRRRPPPIPISKTNYIEENIDMIKNKENFYHRYPAKKYENLYSKRKDLVGEGNNNRKSDASQNQDFRADYDQTQTSMNNPVATYSDPQHRSSLPVTINLNPDNHSQSGHAPIPLDSHVSRTGDKISVNIDLRLVDLQNLKRQQENSEHPDYSGLDPLDRHIRKLERSIDQSLPQITSPTQRSPTLTNPTVNASMGRYGKSTTGAGSGGYNPPNYHTDEYYNYGDKGKEEDSYLARMNNIKRGPQFKPYTGRDYEQFKKNYGFGGGYLGFDFDNPNYKEKSDKLTKTKEYAQQIEVRNKKKLAEAPRRTLSDTRLPTEVSKTQRALEYARVSTRHKQASDALDQPDTNGSAPPHRRPTEVLHRPPPPPPQKKALKPTRSEDNELVERLALRHERDKAQVQGMLNPSGKRREPLFDDDDRHTTDIERQAQDRANQRRVSPQRQLPPSGVANNTNGRRPLRFDRSEPSDESSYPPPPPPQQYQQQYRPSQQPPPVSSSSSQPPPPPRRSGHQPSSSSPPPPRRSGYQPSSPPPQHQQSRRSDHQPSSSSPPPPPHHQQRTPSHQPPYSHNRQSARQHQSETNIDELANRHNDEKMLMEAIRVELSERPLGDDEELIVVEQ